MRTPVAAVGSAVFFVVGPGTVAGVVPWVLSGWHLRHPWAWWPIAQVLGAVLVAAGLAVIVHAFVRFVVEGLGTPVPAAAPSRLVVGGLYRWVRNPMYVALLAMIVGQAVLFASPGVLAYGAAAWVFAASYVRWREEPVLLRRFGADYAAYRAAVPAWIPRLRPWRPGPAV